MTTHNATEQAYKNGYQKGYEDALNVAASLYESRMKELDFTRKFIRKHELHFALASEWSRERKENETD